MKLVLLILIFVLCILFIRLCNIEEQFTTEIPSKIAFCFLIYDKFNHPDIWHNFFENADP